MVHRCALRNNAEGDRCSHGWAAVRLRLARAISMPFLQGLRRHGYEDGQTIDIVYRWADGDPSRLPYWPRS